MLGVLALWSGRLRLMALIHDLCACQHTTPSPSLPDTLQLRALHECGETSIIVMSYP
jgi:hypothetical protein